MTALRTRLEQPIEDRRRAFAIVAAVLLVAAAALSALAAPPGHQPADKPVGRQSAAAVGDDRPVPAEAPPAAVAVARRFLEGYLDHLYRSRRERDIVGASAGLRRQLTQRRLRVSPGMRRHRPRLVDVDLHRLDGAWLADGEIAVGKVSFEIAFVVADRPGGHVVTRLVEH